MTGHVALLHSVVLDRSRRVSMSDLRAMADGLGFGAPRTLVATGNLVFDTDDADARSIERRLEAAFVRSFGRHVDIIVRTAAAWRRLAAGNPFPAESREDGSRVIVRVMRAPLAPATAEGLAAHAGDEQVRAVDGDLWVLFPRQPSTSRLLGMLTTRRLGIGTARNWNTVRGLADMLER
jgi:uncharacterized protein (DUF1697 family)